MRQARANGAFPMSAAVDGDPLLRIDSFLDGAGGPSLAADVRAGLTARRKTLPPKYFYDDRGSELFDAICDLPEYYPTRTETSLLRRIANELVAATRPTHLIELGSGASRKTRVLLDAFAAAGGSIQYIPMDVSEGMLRQSTAALREEYPWMPVHGIVGDYEHHLEWIPAGKRRLVLFLGSTIGNFTEPEAIEFLGSIAANLSRGDFLLVGMDLRKPVEILHAAYNDAAGVTAEFNKNVLRVINRELDADFDLERYEHVAYFNPEASQVEMYLRSSSRQKVRIGALDLTIEMAPGETIHTEISRKFDRGGAGKMFAAAGLQLRRWYTPPNDYFALALGVVR